MAGFKPFGIPMTRLERVTLLYEEYEAVRLSDYEGLLQEQAAERMNVSRPTFTRIYEKARRTIAQAFVEGKAIFIEGGNYHIENSWYKCKNCHRLNHANRQDESCSYCCSGELKNLNQQSDDKQNNR
jgi:predicted DNA-binding protein (UPF0251 family)